MVRLIVGKERRREGEEGSLGAGAEAGDRYVKCCGRDKGLALESGHAKPIQTFPQEQTPTNRGQELDFLQVARVPAPLVLIPLTLSLSPRELPQKTFPAAFEHLPTLLVAYHGRAFAKHSDNGDPSSSCSPSKRFWCRGLRVLRLAGTKLLSPFGLHLPPTPPSASFRCSIFLSIS